MHESSIVGSCILNYHNPMCHSVSNDIKNYFDFCTLFGRKHSIENPTSITCSSSSIINHILASLPDRVTQQKILNVGLSDHQLICSTREITRIKRGAHNQIKLCSFKNYTVEINFPEYEDFDNVNDASFIQKLMEVIDKVAQVKNKRIKKNSQGWFDSQISENLIIWDKLFKKYKKKLASCK